MRKRRNKRLRKKGLSAVVTTLIIILLVLVSTGTIWVVIKNLIIGGVEEISLGKFSTELNIKSVKVEGEILSVGVERAVGKGDLVKLKFIFENGTDSEIIERETDIEELDEKSFIFSLGDLSLLNIKKVSIVPIYKSSSGKEVSGDIIDIFNLKKPIRGEAGTWEYIGNFEKLGFSGAGRKEYSISSQSENIVKIKKAIVDPLDVLPGFNQTFTIHVYSPYGVIDVTTTTELDNSTLNLDLQEIGEEGGNQIFSATWVVNDVHTETYRTHITATDAEGNSDSVTLTWTDACQAQISFSNHGADKTLSTDCNTGTNAIGGLDGGNIILGTNVNLIIDSGAQFIFNNGKSITITASGASITSTSTGSFGNGELYYMDADGDGYALGTALLLGAGANRVRASDPSIIGLNDCADASGNGDKWVNRNCYLDTDNDGWTTGGLISVCKGSACNSPTGHQASATATDCSPSDGSRWRNRYDDTDGDAYCSSSSLYCVGNHAGYRDSCTSYSDCNDGNGAVQVNKYYDGDWDGYCTSGSPTYCVAAGAGNPYRSSCTGYSDCNDNVGTIWVNRNCYLDADGDTYTTGGAVSVCKGSSCESPAGHRTSQTTNDCCDTDANAKPEQTAWFTTERIGCGGYDYDCVDGKVKRWTATGGDCEECYWTFRCNTFGQGRGGWVGSSPACGNSGTYVSNPGYVCDTRETQGDCDYDYCISGSRTQSCH